MREPPSRMSRPRGRSSGYACCRSFRHAGAVVLICATSSWIMGKESKAFDGNGRCAKINHLPISAHFQVENSNGAMPNWFIREPISDTADDREAGNESNSWVAAVSFPSVGLWSAWEKDASRISEHLLLLTSSFDRGINSFCWWAIREPLRWRRNGLRSCQWNHDSEKINVECWRFADVVDGVFYDETPVVTVANEWPFGFYVERNPWALIGSHNRQLTIGDIPLTDGHAYIDNRCNHNGKREGQFNPSVNDDATKTWGIILIIAGYFVATISAGFRLVSIVYKRIGWRRHIFATTGILCGFIVAVHGANSFLDAESASASHGSFGASAPCYGGAEEPLILAPGIPVTFT